MSPSVYQSAHKSHGGHWRVDQCRNAGAVFPSFASFASRISASGHVGKGIVASCLIWLALGRGWLAQSPIKMPLTYHFGLGDLAVIVKNVKFVFPGKFQWNKLERFDFLNQSRLRIKEQGDQLHCRQHTPSPTFHSVGGAQRRHIRALDLGMKISDHLRDAQTSDKPRGCLLNSRLNGSAGLSQDLSANTDLRLSPWQEKLVIPYLINKKQRCGLSPTRHEYRESAPYVFTRKF